MTKISIEAALGSGFGLIRRRPLTVLGWGLVQIAIAAVVLALLAPFYTAMISRVAAAAQLGVRPPFEIADMMRMQGVNLFVNIGGAFVRAVLFCAVWRAVLHPEQGRFAYLRIGAAELYVFLFMIVAVVVVMADMLIVLVPGAVIVGVLAASHAVGAAVIVGVVGGVALFVGAIYVALRFSMVGPMIVDDGRFHLLESWSLTKGSVGSLLAIALCLVAILLVGELVVGCVFLGLGAGMLGSAAGGLHSLRTFFSQSPAVYLPRLAPLLTVVAVLAVPLAGCVMAVLGRPGRAPIATWPFRPGMGRSPDG